MSAPNTNENKDPAHKPPIYGMIAVVLFALVLLFALITWLTYEGNNPQDDGPVDADLLPQSETTPQLEAVPQLETLPQSEVTPEPEAN